LFRSTGSCEATPRQSIAAALLGKVVGDQIHLTSCAWRFLGGFVTPGSEVGFDVGTMEGKEVETMLRCQAVERTASPRRGKVSKGGGQP